MGLIGEISSIGEIGRIDGRGEGKIDGKTDGRIDATIDGSGEMGIIDGSMGTIDAGVMGVIGRSEIGTIGVIGSIGELMFFSSEVRQIPAVLDFCNEGFKLLQNLNPRTSLW